MLNQKENLLTIRSTLRSCPNKNIKAFNVLNNHLNVQVRGYDVPVSFVMAPDETMDEFMSRISEYFNESTL